MKMLKQISLVVLAIIIVILGLAAMKPDTFSVRRSVSIKAPPEKVAALITDFHQWGSWSPWENLDSAMKRTFTGAASGKGAIYEWEGNKQVGKGRMEITDDGAPAKTVIKLDFLQPFESHNTTKFTLVPQGGETLVTWDMSGPMPFISKIISVFSSMDAMIGKDFEKGLSNMKSAAEK
jgi:carbon monoxide dehydrogenase subunit G